MPLPDPSARLEPGSFRDPESRVFYAEGEVFRALSPEGLKDFEALASSGLLDDPRIVGTELAESAPAAAPLTKDVAAVLRHERIPFVSYPYEWTFSMLKDAALLQLDLLLAALDRDLILKDSTPYNVQFEGTRPLFIDVGSFEHLREDELWVGYRQFCTLYLYPLLLQATKGVSFQPWLRGSIDGVTPADMRALMSFRDRFRRGFTTNVFLHARLEQRDAGGRAGIKSELRRPGVGKELILANVRKMRKLVARLEWSPPEGVWVAYGEHNTYTGEDARRKDEFVRAIATSKSWPLVWDLGCNNGRHSRIAAEGAGHVVAIDADQGPVELLYRELRDAGDRKILPLTMNIADPSPGLGWRGLERKPLLDRERPDLVLALALVHHLAIGANVPVRELVDWLAALGGALVIEFPTREDPMVQKLLAPKREGLHPDYERGFFESCLNEAFDVQRSEELGSGTRILYFATPRGGVI
ncbi:MAG: class I SAM-dependent methyltransferase [Actinomycetota bacterium]|nr:class I SAM-dependent methyltransferase [Actinomycetota bacterium]